MTTPPPIIDAHTHAFPDDIAGRAIALLSASGRWAPTPAHTDGTVRGLLASMDAAGVHGAIVCSIATKPTQVRKITDWSAATLAAHGGRLIPFASIHPDFESPEAEAERIAALGIGGIKMHPQYMGVAADDPRTHRVVKAAARAGLAVTFHAGYDIAFDHSDVASPASLRRLYDAVPGLTLQCCHLGGWRRWEESLAHLVGLPIYLETSFALGDCPPELLEAILTRHPPEYIMWGTDSPWNDQGKDLAAFRALNLPSSRERLALYDNAMRLAGRSRMLAHPTAL